MTEGCLDFWMSGFLDVWMLAGITLPVRTTVRMGNQSECPDLHFLCFFMPFVLRFCIPPFCASGFLQISLPQNPLVA